MTNISEIEEQDEDTKIEAEKSTVDDLPVRFNVSSYGWDTDVDGLVKRLNRGDIYRPNFQRKFVWNTADKSRFVESLILGLPVPSIFLALDQDTKKMNIVDGQQRLCTLQEYFSGGFSLSASDIQDNLKGRYYKLPEGRKSGKILDEADSRTLENALIHAVVIKQDQVLTDQDTKNNSREYNEAVIQIFKRLNTTGRALQAQEVRSCILHGSLNDLLGTLNQNSDWRSVFGAEHSRLKDMEAILRFLALLENHASYKAPMPKFLNNFMEDNRSMPSPKVEELALLFNESIRVLRAALGDTCFKTGTTFQISKFDCVMVGLATRLKSNNPINLDSIAKAESDLLAHPYYIYGTKEFINDGDRVAGRINAAISIFSAA